MRRTATLLSTLLLSLLPTGALGSHAAGHYDLIIPGERIGEARLGMHETQVAAVNASAGCRVTATYVDGEVVRLTTNYGGACSTRAGTQVGMNLNSIRAEFGRPSAIRPDGAYPHAVAVWEDFSAVGIGFRVLIYPDRSTLIQSIAVFPKQ